MKPSKLYSIYTILSRLVRIPCQSVLSTLSRCNISEQALDVCTFQACVVGYYQQIASFWHNKEMHSCPHGIEACSTRILVAWTHLCRWKLGTDSGCVCALPFALLVMLWLRHIHSHCQPTSGMFLFGLHHMHWCFCSFALKSIPFWSHAVQGA